MKHTDSAAAVLGAIAGALGAGQALDFIALLRQMSRPSGGGEPVWVAQASKGSPRPMDGTYLR